MSNLTEEHISEFREAFEVFDKDKDGSITIDELADLMKALNLAPTDQEIVDMKNEIDVDQNGNVDFKEFITLIARRVRDSDLEQENIEAFKVFDRNEDNLISKEELKFVMYVLSERLIGEPITDEEVAAMMAQADEDGDGYISYKEFCEVLAKH